MNVTALLSDELTAIYESITLYTRESDPEQELRNMHILNGFLRMLYDKERRILNAFLHVEDKSERQKLLERCFEMRLEIADLYDCLNFNELNELESI